MWRHAKLKRRLLALAAAAAQRGALDVVRWHPWDGTPADLRSVIVLRDAKWSWEHVATQFGSERTEIVDWYHATEHVWSAAKELYGDNTHETQAWSNTPVDELWHHGPKPMLKWFDATQPKAAAAPAMLQLPIGSSAVEASAKPLVQHRTKQAGSRWSDLSARAILDPRCHLLSGRSLD
jgi:hypothetical protein